MAVSFEHPADPVDRDDSTHGGFADIARRLNALYPERPKPISRQLVFRWYQCRGSGTNGFPAPCPVEDGGRREPLFVLQEVVDWYVDREEKRSAAVRRIQVAAQRPLPGTVDPMNTIPLFDVDGRGHPIDRETAARQHPSVPESRYGSLMDY